MPYIRIWIHAVWTVKDRKPLLTKEIRNSVYQHIKENAKNKNIFLDQINGHDEHIHCLISIDATQSLANIMNLIKGESSHWINANKLSKFKFEWQDEYFAVSIGQSQVDTVRKYILNQEQHHKKITFQQEYREFIDKYGFDILKG